MAECAACSEKFEPANKLARFCKRDECVRSRARDRKRKQLGVAPSPPASETMEASSGSPYAAVLRVLKETGQVDSPDGQIALELARRLTFAGSDTGSSVAAVARELRTALRDAIQEAQLVGDPLDELRERRARRLGFGA